ncbi:MAG: extracellular solute-binding protein [Candidatus Kapabacteria bacterium]|nr:extracellular solute-binding protein [Candidatus Kapabacteria bacterium]
MSLLKISLLLFCLIIINSCKDKNSLHEEKIKFWHFWSEPNQRKALNELITKFESENHCKVEVTELSWNDGKMKLMAAFNSNTAPDVLELGSDWVAQFSSSGVLTKLDKDSMNTNKFISFSLAPSTWASNIYALPWVIDTRVMFYNIDLMTKAGLNAAPPKNIDELINYSEKINSLGEVYGIGTNGSDQHRLYKKFLPLLWSYGGEIIDKNGKPSLNLPENVQALETYLQLSRIGIIETQRQIDSYFIQGKVGFWVSGAWLLQKLQKENPNLKFGLALIPGFAEKPSYSFAGGEYLAINQKSKNQKLAQQLIKFLTDGKNIIEFCKKIPEAGFPADSAYFNNEYYKTQTLRLVFTEQLKHSKMTPVHPKWLDIEALLENAVVEALYGRKSAQEALDDAQKESLILE